MREINITINKNNINYLHYLKNCIANLKLKFYTAVCEINDMAVLSMAIKDEDFSVVQNKLKHLISEVILFVYKEKYLQQHIDFSKLKGDYQSALLKALVLFDSESDKQFIKQRISLDKDIYLDSFYHFKLQPLQKRWNEFVSLTNKNGNLLESDAFLELLKFLIATIKPKTNLVHVYYNDGVFEYRDKHNKPIISNIIEQSNDEVNLITTLITLAPNNIALHCIDAITNNTFKVLYYIFDKKINLLV